MQLSLVKVLGVRKGYGSQDKNRTRNASRLSRIKEGGSPIFSLDLLVDLNAMRCI